GAVREDDGATDVLVRLPRIDAELHRQLDGLVELRLPVLGYERADRLVEGVLPPALDPRSGLLIALAPLRHRSLPHTTSRPRLRAVPSTVRIACSIDAAVRSGIFSRAISSTCWRVTWPTFFLPGSPDPFSMPAARLRSTAAGGVLVMKVNDRSAYTVMMTGMMS